jgi:hypothetical protein
MTDRDTLAAAALTGLLAGPGDKDFSADYWARHAYEAADTMLRERERTTNDASPEAGRPSMGAEDGRVRASALSTGNTQETVAWAIQFAGEDIDVRSVFSDMESACRHVANYAGKNQIVPLYRSPRLTDEEREAIAIAADSTTVCIPPIKETLRSLLERMS